MSDVRKPDSRPFDIAERDKIISMWEAGHTHTSIGMELGRSSGSISSGIRRLAAAGLVQNRVKARSIPGETRETIVRMWNEGCYKNAIGREVGMSEDALDSALRRMIAAGIIEARPKVRTHVSALSDEDLPPPKVPLGRAAVQEQRYLESARRGGANSAATRGAAMAKPPEQAVEPDRRAIKLYKGESGVELFPYPPGLEGTPLLGGIGKLPEARHAMLCQWLMNEPKGWKEAKFCSHAAIRGGVYCPGHHGIACVSLVDYRTKPTAE